MKLLSVDLETTGLDTNTCEPIELGFAFYDTELAGESPLIMKSHFVLPKENLNEEVQAVTGLTDDILHKYGVHADEAFFDFLQFINEHKPDALVGHNILAYDRPIIKRVLTLLSPAKLEHQCPIIDTKVDLPFKVTPKSTSLVFLAADQAKFVNPFAHRALFDAMACMKLLFMHNLTEVLQMASTPLVEVRADVSFNNKDLAKKAGYNWDNERKVWLKLLRLGKLAAEKQKCPFPVITLQAQESTLF